MVSFTVNIAPVAKARPRVSMRHGRAFAYTPKKSADYERLIAEQCPKAPMDGPLALKLQFGIPIPASWSKRKKADALSGVIRPTSRPDIDNYVNFFYLGFGHSSLAANLRLITRGQLYP